MSESVRVIADGVVCIGSGNCVAAAPTVFALDDEGAVIVLRDEVEGEEAEQAVAAVDNCPAFALSTESR